MASVFLEDLLHKISCASEFHKQGGIAYYFSFHGVGGLVVEEVGLSLGGVSSRKLQISVLKNSRRLVDTFVAFPIVN